MGQHTPGKWEVDTDFEPGENITIEVQGSPIALVYSTDSFSCLDEDDDADQILALQAENVATAYVMAAASDLLAALRDCEGLLDSLATRGIESWLPPGTKDLWVLIHQNARAAIAKAEPPDDGDEEADDL